MFQHTNYNTKQWLVGKFTKSLVLCYELVLITITSKLCIGWNTTTNGIKSIQREIVYMRNQVNAERSCLR